MVPSDSNALLDTDSSQDNAKLETLKLSHFLGDFDDDDDDENLPRQFFEILLAAVKIIAMGGFCVLWLGAGFLSNTFFLLATIYYGYFDPIDRVLRPSIGIFLIQCFVLALVIVLLLIVRPKTIEPVAYLERWIYKAFPITFVIFSGVYLAFFLGLFAAYASDRNNQSPQKARLVLFTILSIEAVGSCVIAVLNRKRIMAHFTSMMDEKVPQATYSRLELDESTHGVEMYGIRTGDDDCESQQKWSLTQHADSMIAEVIGHSLWFEHDVPDPTVTAQYFDPGEDTDSLAAPSEQSAQTDENPDEQSPIVKSEVDNREEGVEGNKDLCALDIAEVPSPSTVTEIDL
jgi:hypothetical protein